jgi:hypothetical protein
VEDAIGEEWRARDALVPLLDPGLPGPGSPGQETRRDKRVPCLGIRTITVHLFCSMVSGREGDFCHYKTR